MDHQTMLIGSVFKSGARRARPQFRDRPARRAAGLRDARDTLDAIDAKRAESVLREMTDPFRLPWRSAGWRAPRARAGGARARLALGRTPPCWVGETAALPSGTCASRWAWARTCRARARVRVRGDGLGRRRARGAGWSGRCTTPRCSAGFRARARRASGSTRRVGAAKVHATLEVFLPADLEGEGAQREMVEKIRAFIERRPRWERWTRWGPGGLGERRRCFPGAIPLDVTSPAAGTH